MNIRNFPTTTPLPPRQKPEKKKVETPPPRLPESPYPVYWVEAWSQPAQRWITVDPFTPANTARPHKLAPPSSDAYNTLSYALAFESPLHAVDVTRRYAAHFTGKTRRQRVTSTKNGEQWYAHLLQRCFARLFALDRDQLEAAEFAQLELDEPVPRAVQDLKGHPLFALKRHLRRGEVIFPERRAGTVKVGASVEPIFRRQDVQQVKTADAWYKLGRVVRDGELPLKFTAPRRRPREHDDGERPDTPMFAAHQTDLYAPPPVVNGLVPKNRFRNLDIFVPSMVPAGGVHVPHPLARRAAEIVGVDFTEAVTGFEFRNRLATPLVKGVVVAAEFAEAVEAVIEGLEWEKEVQERREVEMEALERWRKWLLRLQIRERLGMGKTEDE